MNEERKVIEIKEVSKSYDKKVLDKVSFTVEPGSIMVITGPSGKGKTTLLNIMMGLVSPDSGEVIGIPEKKSCVFQEDRLLENFTVEENLKLVSELPVEKLKEECSVLLGEKEFSQKVREFSGGMKRRVSILRALLTSSEVIFMDEPFKGLDAELKEKVIRYTLEKRKDRTLFVVTHDMSEAEQLGTIYFKIL